MGDYSRVLITTTIIPVKEEEDNNETGYSWADDYRDEGYKGGY